MSPANAEAGSVNRHIDQNSGGNGLAGKSLGGYWNSKYNPLYLMHL